MDIKSERSSGWLFYILVKIDLTLQRFGITCRTWSPPGCPWWGVRVGRKTKVLTHPQGKWPSGIMIKDVLMKIKMSTCVKVQETHFYRVSWRFSKKYILLRGGMPSLLKFLSIPLISLFMSMFQHFKSRQPCSYHQHDDLKPHSCHQIFSLNRWHKNTKLFHKICLFDCWLKASMTHGRAAWKWPV